jgi:hypothetical protein
LLLGVLMGMSASEAREVELVRDRHFNTGFTVWVAAPVEKTVAGTLLPSAEAATPVWGMAQWASRYPFTDYAGHVGEHGDLEFHSPGKLVVMGGSGSPRADLVLAVDGIREYGGAPRLATEPWTHLLVEQEFRKMIPVTQLSGLRFRISVRLLKCHADPEVTLDPGIHATQFLFYLSIQNRNEQSPGFGDYVWFGVPLYDNREPMPGRYVAHDPGTDRLIYTLATETLARESTHSGEWVTFEKDLLPDVRAALEEAWTQGYLKGSRDPADFAAAGMNLGWEVPGSYDVAAQVRGLRFLAQTQ